MWLRNCRGGNRGPRTMAPVQVQVFDRKCAAKKVLPWLAGQSGIGALIALVTGVLRSRTESWDLGEPVLAKKLVMEQADV